MSNSHRPNNQLAPAENLPPTTDTKDSNNTAMTLQLDLDHTDQKEMLDGWVQLNNQNSEQTDNYEIASDLSSKGSSPSIISFSGSSVSSHQPVATKPSFDKTNNKNQSPKPQNNAIEQNQMCDTAYIQNVIHQVKQETAQDIESLNRRYEEAEKENQEHVNTIALQQKRINSLITQVNYLSQQNDDLKNRNGVELLEEQVRSLGNLGNQVERLENRKENLERENANQGAQIDAQREQIANLQPANQEPQGGGCKVWGAMKSTYVAFSGISRANASYP